MGWAQWMLYSAKYLALSDRYPTGETGNQAFWRTIVADCSENGYERAPISFLSSYNKFFELLSHAEQIIETDNPRYDGIRAATGITISQSDPEMRAFYRELSRATKGHRLCLTEKGLHGSRVAAGCAGRRYRRSTGWRRAVCASQRRGLS